MAEQRRLEGDVVAPEVGKEPVNGLRVKQIEMSSGWAYSNKAVALLPQRCQRLPPDARASESAATVCLQQAHAVPQGLNGIGRCSSTSIRTMTSRTRPRFSDTRRGQAGSGHGRDPARLCDGRGSVRVPWHRILPTEALRRYPPWGASPARAHDLAASCIEDGIQPVGTPFGQVGPRR